MDNPAIAHSGLPRRTLAFGKEIIFNRGNGEMVTDTEGREYVDFVLGYGSVVLGHATDTYRHLFQNYCESGTLMPGYTSWHYELLALLLGKSAQD
jgi:glutamate-1-semialdehyde 2,1-aminomutase